MILRAHILIGHHAAGERRSTRKSDLVGSAWANKRKAAAAGKEILTRHCPAWLRPNLMDGIRDDPERAEVIKRIIRLVKEGKGKRAIARTLDGEGYRAGREGSVGARTTFWNWSSHGHCWANCIC